MTFRIKSIFLNMLIATNCLFPLSFQGSVASADPLANEAGMAILAKGGNAFDAAIAVASTLNVVEPMMSGLGGYGTILIYNANEKRIRFLNPSGRFPEQTNSDLMRPPTADYMKNRFSAKSISTPGNLNAWVAMHQLYGKLGWQELFASAIDIADQGFAINETTAAMIELAFAEFSDYSKSFYGKNGTPLKEGDRLVQHDLAKTYRQIAKNGASVFYQGEIAKLIAKKMKETESFLTADDLRKNEAEWWEPLKIRYRDYDVYAASLPANSFAAFVNLGLMNQVKAGELQHNSADYLHLFAEMTKESYKARLNYSFDPDIQKSPLEQILSPDYLKKQLAGLDRNHASEFVPFDSEESRNTTHFVVIDQWGNIVSATQTLGNLFGSRVMVDGTGIWMNSSMAYSTFEPKGNPMDAFPGRHKLSGDCPVIIMKDGLPWAALGTPGGHTITQNVPQIIFNLIDFQMSMQEAIDAPKLVFVEPDRILVDPDLDETVIQSLKEKGHNVFKRYIGNANGIRILRDANRQINGYDVGMDTRRIRRNKIN